MPSGGRGGADVPPWLTDALAAPAGPSPALLAVRLALSVALGFLVAAIYGATNGRDVAPSFRTTLVLLTILIAAVTQVIGDNVARAFSLVGALSIVRFRTVVQDTRDTAFVIFAVAVGMAVGAGDLWVAALAMAAVTLAAHLLRPRGEPRREYLLTICLAAECEADAALGASFARWFEHFRAEGAATAARGASVETTYRVTLAPEADPAVVVRDLNDLEGVQSVALRATE